MSKVPDGMANRYTSTSPSRSIRPLARMTPPALAVIAVDVTWVPPRSSTRTPKLLVPAPMAAMMAIWSSALVAPL